MGVPSESAVQVEPKIANMLGSGDGNVIEENRRAGLTTECEGDVGALGSIHLDTPSPARKLTVYLLYKCF